MDSEPWSDFELRYRFEHAVRSAFNFGDATQYIAEYSIPKLNVPKTSWNVLSKTRGGRMNKNQSHTLLKPLFVPNLAEFHAMFNCQHSLKLRADGWRFSTSSKTCIQGSYLSLDTLHFLESQLTAQLSSYLGYQDPSNSLPVFVGWRPDILPVLLCPHHKCPACMQTEAKNLERQCPRSGCCEGGIRRRSFSRSRSPPSKKKTDGDDDDDDDEESKEGDQDGHDAESNSCC